MSDCRFGVSPVNYPDPDPFRKGHSCETQLTVINDWAKSWTTEDRLTSSYWILKKAFDTPLMNSLKANCIAMELVARH